MTVPGMEQCIEMLENSGDLPQEMMDLAIAIADGKQCKSETNTVTQTEYIDVEVEVEIEKIVNNCISRDTCFTGTFNDDSGHCDFVDNDTCTLEEKAHIACYDSNDCTLEFYEEGKCRLYNICHDDYELMCNEERMAECDDHNPCTVDTCFPETGECYYEPAESFDEFECPTVYNQDGTCYFEMTLGDRAVVNNITDKSFGRIVPSVSGSVLTSKDLTFESAQSRVGALGDYQAIPPFISAIKSCYSKEKPVNVLVMGDEQCSLDNLDYPDEFDGFHIAYIKNPFTSDYVVSSIMGTAESLAMSFDIVVVCNVIDQGPLQWVTVGERIFSTFLKKESFKYLLFVSEGVDLTLNQNVPSKHREIWIRFTRFNAMLSHWGLNFGPVTRLQLEEEDYDFHAYIKK